MTKKRSIVWCDPEEHREICDDKLWDFSNDLLDAILFSLTQPTKTFHDYTPKATEPEEYRLGDDERLAISYIFLLGIAREKSLRVGKNTKREVHSEAAEIGINNEEAQAFFKMLTTDLLSIVFD